ncbi:MAG: T9SS type A sorting domain-containing protein, partial [Bacteroidia bacterium]
NPNVASVAMFHFTSPTCGAAVITSTANSTNIQVKMPMTVTNSNPLIQGTANTHYYSTETLNFLFTDPSGFNELQKDALQFAVYPNPASQKVNIALDLLEPSNLEISVLNYLGQVVKQKNYKAQFGKNEIEIDLTTIKSGIYFVTVKSGSNVATKKLVVE